MSSPVPNNELTRFQAGEEQVAIARKGGIASGETRRRNASIKQSLKRILNSGFRLPTEIKDEEVKGFVKKLNSIGVDTKNLDLVDLMNLGQILSAIGGKAENYKALMDITEEQEDTGTPIVEINVVDNSNLEKVMYEENRHNKNA
jgi:hypothetical protein